MLLNPLRKWHYESGTVGQSLIVIRPSCLPALRHRMVVFIGEPRQRSLLAWALRPLERGTVGESLIVIRLFRLPALRHRMEVPIEKSSKGTSYIGRSVLGPQAREQHCDCGDSHCKILEWEGHSVFRKKLREIAIAVRHFRELQQSKLMQQDFERFRSRFRPNTTLSRRLLYEYYFS